MAAKAAARGHRPGGGVRRRGDLCELFAPLTEYAWPERVGLILTLLIAVAGLVYAGMLVGQVVGADQGTAEDARGRPTPSARGPGPT